MRRRGSSVIAYLLTTALVAGSLPVPVSAAAEYARSSQLRRHRRSRCSGHCHARRDAAHHDDRCAGRVPHRQYRGWRVDVPRRDAWLLDALARRHDWSRCAADDVGTVAPAIRGDHTRTATARAASRARARIQQSVIVDPLAIETAEAGDAADGISACRRCTAANPASAAGGRRPRRRSACGFGRCRRRIPDQRQREQRRGIAVRAARGLRQQSTTPGCAL